MKAKIILSAAVAAILIAWGAVLCLVAVVAETILDALFYVTFVSLMAWVLLRICRQFYAWVKQLSGGL